LSRSVLTVSFKLLPGLAEAEETDAELARQPTNPLAELVSLPISVNLNRNLGWWDDGTRLTTNVQPMTPFELNEDWNLITRMIMPAICQDDLFPGAESQFGLGGINASVFLSPLKPTDWGLTWGAGPVVLLPTAVDEPLGGEKWGSGPAAVGLLANHSWSLSANAVQ
jgi:hypothetical protein